MSSAAGFASMSGEREVPNLRFGIMLWTQATDWPQLLRTAQLVDRLGYDHLWAPDHLYAPIGDPYQPDFEGWTTLAAWAVATERSHLGVLVCANTFRNPGLVAKMATTLDHISGGRAILGIGGGWAETEHTAHGIDFGRGTGERLGWLDESASIIRALLAGEEVTHHTAKYTFERVRTLPRPVQPHLPVLIGGTGEKKTLLTVARYADMWNAIGSVDELRRKDRVLRAHCAAIGRDEATIERTVDCRMVIRDDRAEAKRVWEDQLRANRAPLSEDPDPWLGSPQEIAKRILGYQAIGFGTVIAELGAPFDVETIERLVGEVRPMVSRATSTSPRAQAAAASTTVGPRK